jgi:hypothetical protein
MAFLSNEIEVRKTASTAGKHYSADCLVGKY